MYDFSGPVLRRKRRMKPGFSVLRILCLSSMPEIFSWEDPRNSPFCEFRGHTDFEVNREKSMCPRSENGETCRPKSRPLKKIQSMQKCIYIHKLFWIMNFASVIRWTWSFFAIADFEKPASRQCRMMSSFPVNFVWLLFRPLGRPKITPSARLRANASFVRCDIRFRSISADKLNAKARTFELISAPSL